MRLHGPISQKAIIFTIPVKLFLAYLMRLNQVQVYAECMRNVLLHHALYKHTLTKQIPITYYHLLMCNESLRHEQIVTDYGYEIGGPCTTDDIPNLPEEARESD
jgi:hypothetical protein